MSGLQELATQWLTSLGALLPLGFAFGAGMVAAVNPCGFAMLPAYLSLYLGSREAGFGKRPALGRVFRAVLIGGVVSMGFVLLFSMAGVIVAAGGSVIMEAMPWFGVVIGGASSWGVSGSSRDGRSTPVSSSASPSASAIPER